MPATLFTCRMVLASFRPATSVHLMQGCRCRISFSSVSTRCPSKPTGEKCFTFILGEQRGVLCMVECVCELSSMDVVASWSSELEFSSSEFFLMGLCLSVNWVLVLSLRARRRSTDRLLRTAAVSAEERGGRPSRRPTLLVLGVLLVAAMPTLLALLR